MFGSWQRSAVLFMTNLRFWFFFFSIGSEWWTSNWNLIAWKECSRGMSLWSFQFTTVGGAVMRYSTTWSAAHGQTQRQSPSICVVLRLGCDDRSELEQLLSKRKTISQSVKPSQLRTRKRTSQHLKLLSCLRLPLFLPSSSSSLQLDVCSFCPVHRHLGCSVRRKYERLALWPLQLLNFLFLLKKMYTLCTFFCESLPVKKTKQNIKKQEKEHLIFFSAGIHSSRLLSVDRTESLRLTSFSC